LDQTKDVDLVSAGRELTRTGLHDGAAENRLQAIRLAMRPELDLLEAVVPLLSDPQPEVRRSALLTVGSAPDAISTDDLLPWLHDPDEDVRRLCEKALRSRGLQEDHLCLGRLMTDSRPGTRLQVLNRLRYANDLEPGVWLRRLSHDPAPAVRAAAIRAASEHVALAGASRSCGFGAIVLQ
jgi:HEAT repeat protein